MRGQIVHVAADLSRTMVNRKYFQLISTVFYILYMAFTRYIMFNMVTERLSASETLLDRIQEQLHMNWKQSAVILGIVGIMSAGALLAQSDFFYDVEIPEATEPLVLAEAVTGELTEDSPILAYSLDLTTEDTVQINVDFDEIDGYLLIANADGDVVAYNDDGAGMNNSSIAPFQPEEDGTYTVAVSSYSFVTSEGDDTSVEGTFELTASSLELTPIAVGDEVEAELTDDVPVALYTLDIAEGQILAVTLESDDFDAKVTVTPAEEGDQDELSNDDYGDGLNAQVGPYLFYEEGTYIIRAEESYADDRGDYTLRVSEFTPEAIELGAATRGEVALGSFYAFYSFEGTDGQEVDITVEAVENIDLAFVVYGPDNIPFVGNEDGSDADPELIGLELEDDGTYIVVVYPQETFLSESDLGDFDITVSES